MHIILINGFAESGKDEFVNLVTEEALHSGTITQMISTIQPIKDIYTNLGWDGSKTSEHRNNLHLLKNLWINNTKGLGPLMWTLEQIRLQILYNTDILFIMIREYDEMIKTIGAINICISTGEVLDIKYKDTLSVNTMLVTNPRSFNSGVEKEIQDKFPSNFLYDIIIINNDTRAELLNKARFFLKEVRNGRI